MSSKGFQLFSAVVLVRLDLWKKTKKKTFLNFTDFTDYFKTCSYKKVLELYEIHRTTKKIANIGEKKCSVSFSFGCDFQA